MRSARWSMRAAARPMVIRLLASGAGRSIRCSAGWPSRYSQWPPTPKAGRAPSSMPAISTKKRRSGAQSDATMVTWSSRMAVLQQAATVDIDDAAAHEAVLHQHQIGLRQIAALADAPDRNAGAGAGRHGLAIGLAHLAPHAGFHQAGGQRDRAGRFDGADGRLRDAQLAEEFDVERGDGVVDFQVRQPGRRDHRTCRDDQVVEGADGVEEARDRGGVADVDLRRLYRRWKVAGRGAAACRDHARTRGGGLLRHRATDAGQTADDHYRCVVHFLLHQELYDGAILLLCASFDNWRTI